MELEFLGAAGEVGRSSVLLSTDKNIMMDCGLKIHNIPLAFADLHTFRRFGLTDQPAMLLGMDVLRLCGRVTVDFKRREASFTLD